MARYVVLADVDRGAIVLTASAAAFDGQIGQTSYSASKAGVHGHDVGRGRDLASKLIRVNTLAPGLFDTAMLGRLEQEVRDRLAAGGWRANSWRTGTSTARRCAWTGALRMAPR